jgi:hypothetical protein
MDTILFYESEGRFNNNHTSYELKIAPSFWLISFSVNFINPTVNLSPICCLNTDLDSILKDHNIEYSLSYYRLLKVCHNLETNKFYKTILDCYVTLQVNSEEDLLKTKMVLPHDAFNQNHLINEFHSNKLLVWPHEILRN